MKKTPISWILGTLLVVGILICVALLWTHQLTAVGGNVEDGSHPEPRVALVDFTPVEDTSKLGEPDRNTTKQPLETDDDLFRLCPDPLSDLSSDCWTKLDQLFWDKPMGAHSEFLLLPTSLTYRRIYADPANDRDRVFQALQREECRLENSDIHFDYREKCNAESFANFGSFLAACELIEDRDYLYEWFEPHSLHNGKSRFQLELDYIEQYRILDPDGFTQARREIWLDALESRWRKEKCLEFDMSRPRVIPISEKSKQLGLISFRWGGEQSLDPATTLILIAAKMGEGWSLPRFVFENHVLGSSRQAYERYTVEHDPWFRKLSEALIPVQVRSKRMQAAIESVVALQDMGGEIDLEKLVIGVCESESIVRIYEHGDERRPPASSCREAIEKLSASIPQSSYRELKLLDEFERISLEFGVYDAPQLEHGRE